MQWQDNTTGVIPVPVGTMVEVIYNDGVTSTGVSAGLRGAEVRFAETSNSGRIAYDWTIGIRATNIAKWRLFDMRPSAIKQAEMLKRSIESLQSDAEGTMREYERIQSEIIKKQGRYANLVRHMLP